MIAQTDEHDVSHQRRHRSHVGRDAIGHLSSDADEAFLDELAGLINVGSPVEFDEDKRKADVVDGADAIHSSDSAKGVFQGNGDKRFDFFRRVTTRLGEESDGGFGEIW